MDLIIKTTLDESSSDLSSLDSMSQPPSSPLSMLSRSPSPPTLMYPTPPSSHISSQQSSQSGSPSPDGMDEDGQRSAKRRRISKDRTTEHLDLSGNVIPTEHEPQLERLLKVLHKRRKIVVIAGAGISVSAGIQDFRSKTGLFTTLKTEHKLKGSGKDLFDAAVYRDYESTTSFHDMVQKLSHRTKTALPTKFHQMLASLAHQKRLLRLYSQNVDGIDTALEPLKTNVPLRKGDDGKWPTTIQLHGGLDKMVCSKCHKLSDLDPDLFEGPVAPECDDCRQHDDVRTGFGKRSHGVGRLRPRMVLYSEPSPDADAIGAVTSEDLRKRPDALIVVGTTLKVPGVKAIVRQMYKTVRDHRDGVTIWINNEPPPGGEFKDCFDIVVSSTADIVAHLAQLPHWDKGQINDTTEVAQRKIDIPDTLDPLAPPSSFQFNNSFKAPSPGSIPQAGVALSHTSPEPEPFTPHKKRKPSVLPSIEIKSWERPGATGLLTPLKDQISASKTPFLDKLKKQGNATKVPVKSKQHAPGTAPAKKIASRVKSKKTAPKQQTNTLQATFKQSKNAAVSLSKSKDLDAQDNILVTPKKRKALVDGLKQSPQKATLERAKFPGLINFAAENVVPQQT